MVRLYYEYSMLLLILPFVATFPCKSRLSLPTTGTSTSTTTAFAKRKNTARCEGGLGLMSGVKESVENADSYFAPMIDLSTRSAFEWLRMEGVAWDAVKQDIKEQSVHDKSPEAYLDRIKNNFATFFASDFVGDRELLRAAIGDAITTTGSFSVLVGGVSVGKSTVLQHESKRYSDDERIVLYVDGRSYQKQLAKGLAFEFAKIKSSHYLQNRLAEDNWVRVLETFDTFSKTALTNLATANAAKYMTGGGIDESTQKAVFGIFEDLANDFGNSTNHPKSDSVIALFIDFAQIQKKYPVVIIDEVNEVIDTPNKQQGAESQRTKVAAETKCLLTQFVKYTKQENKLTVLLSTSEYSYPFRLKGMLKLQHLTDIIVAGEVSPKETWKLLTSTTYPSTNAKLPGGKSVIGMGPNLATFFLGAYGGHLLTMRKALIQLSRRKESFIAHCAMPNDLSSDIVKCLKTPEARRLLADMAKFGVAPIEDPDAPAVEMIAGLDLGGVVSIESTAPGLSSAMWKLAGAEQYYALIPSSQSLRLVIGDILTSKKLTGWRRIRFWSRF